LITSCWRLLRALPLNKASPSLTPGDIRDGCLPAALGGRRPSPLCPPANPVWPSDSSEVRKATKTRAANAVFRNILLPIGSSLFDTGLCMPAIDSSDLGRFAKLAFIRCTSASGGHSSEMARCGIN
jgi:hypothetical protein